MTCRLSLAASRLLALLSVGACLLYSGCAAVTNPVAQGIPANNVPPQHLAGPKDWKEPLPIYLLGQPAPDVYRVAAGDILGIYVAGVLGEPDQAPPVNLVMDDVETASLGYPVPVREDGTLTLPMVPPLNVNGLTVEQVEKQVIDAYTLGPAPIIRPERARVIVTLTRPRMTRVVVIRQDSPAGSIPPRRPGVVRSTREFRGAAESLFRGSTSGAGVAVYLPAYQNDVLNAIAQSGGLPGLDAANEIIVQRRIRQVPTAIPPVAEEVAPGVETSIIRDLSLPAAGCPDVATFASGEIIRIPLRVHPDDPIPFRPQDVILQTGDVVFIEARDAEVFYTGGLLPSGEYPVPRDYDLTAVEAVVQVGGPLVNGAVNSNNLTGSLIARGIGAPSPRLLTVIRRTEEGGKMPIIVDLHAALRDPQHDIIIRSGDMLILQETKHQAFARYFTQVFNFSIFSNVISRTDTTASSALSVP